MNKLSTRRIALIGGMIAAGAAAIAITAPHAHADPGTDAQFLAMLARNGFTALSGSEGLITAGHSVCADMAAYTGLDSDALATAGLAESVALRHLNPALTLDSAEQFVAIAVVVMCPWDAPQAARSSGTTTAHTTIPPTGDTTDHSRGNFNPKARIDTSTTSVG